MGKTKRGEITATCTYPPYCIKWIGEKHFLVGGGGGSSKTGVPNKFVRCPAVSFSNNFLSLDQKKKKKKPVNISRWLLMGY